MSNIEQNLQKILTSRYGKDVRQSIHDSIHDCYEDGKAGAVDLVAREQIATLVANVPEGSTKDSELVDIRVGFDGSSYTSAGEAVRGQANLILKEKASKLDLYGEIELSVSLYNEHKLIDPSGHQIDYSNGNVYKIDLVSDSKKIRYQNFKSGTYGIAIYNSKNSVIGGNATSSYETGSFVEINLPENSSYILASYLTDSVPMFLAVSDEISLKSLDNSVNALDERVSKIEQSFEEYSTLPKTSDFDWKLGTTDGVSIIERNDRICNSEPYEFKKGYTVKTYGVTLISVYKYENGKYVLVRNFEKGEYVFEEDIVGIIIFRFEDNRILTLDDVKNIIINDTYRKNQYDLKDGSLDISNNFAMSFDKVELFKKNTAVIVGNGLIMSMYEYESMNDNNGVQIFQNIKFNTFGEDKYVRCAFRFENSAELNEDYRNYIKNNIYVISDNDRRITFGKKMGCLGDSITAGVVSNTPDNFPEFYNEKTSGGSIFNYRGRILSDLQFSEVVNYGISSSTISENSSGVEGVYPFIDRYSSMDDDLDFVFVLGGVNDAIFQTPLGEKESENRTEFYGAMKILCRGLREKYGNKETFIFFATPLQSVSTDSKEIKLSNYVNIIKEVCSEYSIPVLDLYSISGFTSKIDSIVQKYGSDGTHVNGYFHDVILSKLIKNFVTSFLNNSDC